MNNTVVIYALCDPDTRERRYIGKANDLASRVRCHRWEAQSSPLHTHKVNWLRSLDRDPTVEVLEECTKETWAEAEWRWIAESRERGDNLTNFADGGQTSPVEGKGHTEQSKQKMREAAIRNGAKPPSQRGVIASMETRAKLSSAALRRGSKPPPTGGWNKGIRLTRCSAGHEYSLDNTRIVIRADRNRSYQNCKQCERLRMERFRLNQQVKRNEYNRISSTA